MVTKTHTLLYKDCATVWDKPHFQNHIEEEEEEEVVEEEEKYS